MTTLLALATFAALAAAPVRPEIRPPKGASALAITGVDAPAKLLLLRPDRPAPISVRGPGTARLHLFGVLPRKGKQAAAAPGLVLLRLDGSNHDPVVLRSQPVDGWTIVKKPAWRLTTEVTVDIEVPAGMHRLVLIPKGKARLGVALRTEMLAPGSARAGATEPALATGGTPASSVSPDSGDATGGATPPVAEPGAGSTASGSAATPTTATGAATTSASATSGGATTDPATATGAGAATTTAAGRSSTGGSAPGSPPGGEADIPLVAEPPPVEPQMLDRPGFTVSGHAPPPLDIRGRDGTSERFLEVTIDDGLHLDVLGPGTLLVDFHAHRSSTRPETLAPVVIGLLIDDVLVQTLSLDQEESTEFTATAATAFRLAKRATLRVPVGAGAHRVSLSLSDSAVLGLSARPRFETASSVSDPQLLNPELARQNDLTAAGGTPRPQAGVAVSALAGPWQPRAAPGLGVAARLAVEATLPVGSHRLGIGAAFGLTRATGTQAYADARAPDGKGSLSLTTMTVPLAVELSFAPSLPEPLSLSFALGGGVALAWTETGALGGISASPLTPAPLGEGALTLGVRLGPGAMLVRAQGHLCWPVSSGPVRDFDVGGASVMLGYQVATSGTAPSSP